MRRAKPTNRNWSKFPLTKKGAIIRIILLSIWMALMLLKWSIICPCASCLNLNSEDLTKLESKVALWVDERRTLNQEMVLLQIMAGDVNKKKLVNLLKSKIAIYLVKIVSLEGHLMLHLRSIIKFLILTSSPPKNLWRFKRNVSQIFTRYYVSLNNEYRWCLDQYFPI